MFYGGDWHASASGATFATVDPASARTLANVADADQIDLDAAISAAAAAAPGWAATSPRQRGEIAMELGRRVLEHAEDFGWIDTLDNGSPISAMVADAKKGAGAFMEMGGLALQTKGETIPIGGGRLAFTTLQPFGLVARIIAFNHPTLFACARLAPALVAGNAVILKPSGLAPLGALALAEIAADLLPTGVLSILTGGGGLGALIVGDPRIRRLSFTGSVATGLKVLRGAAESGVIKTITLELGGKNPIVVLPDADLDRAADAVVRGMNFTRVQGQSCGSTSRLLVHESIHRELVKRVVDKVGAIRIGMPSNSDVQMGSMISKSAQIETLGFIDRAIAQGGELLIGGHAPSDPALAEGAFVLPTVIDNVRPDSELAMEEVFGPVLAVMSWRDELEAVRLANDTRYALTASIWTRDIDRAFVLADAIEAGYIWINDVETRFPSVPFGGWKDSGSGLENGTAELLSFTRTKAVNLTYAGSA